MENKNTLDFNRDLLEAQLRALETKYTEALKKLADIEIEHRRDKQALEAVFKIEKEKFEREQRKLVEKLKEENKELQAKVRDFNYQVWADECVKKLDEENVEWMRQNDKIEQKWRHAMRQVEQLMKENEGLKKELEKDMLVKKITSGFTCNRFFSFFGGKNDC